MGVVARSVPAGAAAEAVTGHAFGAGAVRKADAGPGRVLHDGGSARTGVACFGCCGATGTEIVPVLGAADPSRQETERRPSWQQQKRERIPLAKMFGMPPGKALVWLPGDEAPRIAHMKGYFETRLRRRASANP